MDKITSCELSVDKVLKPMFGEAVSPWHWWFAWYPVQTWDRRWVWLRYIQRRVIQKTLRLDGPFYWWWEYHRKEGYVRIDNG